MIIEEIELPAPASGSAGILTNIPIPDGMWARLIDVRGSFQTDATVASRVVMLYVDYRFMPVVLTATPTVPASANVQVYFSESGQSVSASSLSAPGHTNGEVFRGLMEKFLRVQVLLNNYGGGDQLGTFRVRYAIGRIEEFNH